MIAFHLSEMKSDNFMTAFKTAFSSATRGTLVLHVVEFCSIKGKNSYYGTDDTRVKFLDNTREKFL